MDKNKWYTIYFVPVYADIENIYFGQLSNFKSEYPFLVKGMKGKTSL